MVHKGQAMGFLGVEQSLTGRRWVGPEAELERAAEMMTQQTDLPRAVCQVLARRGVPVMEARGFLDPKLKELLPDPRDMKDMEVAAARFLDAVRRREKIAVFADYDVDGGSSAALLLVWLRQMGLQATLYVPDRIDEGYGPNVPAMRELATSHDVELLQREFHATDLDDVVCAIAATDDSALNAEISRLAQEQADREEKTREWVAQGKTVEDLLNEFGRI